jgi:hypothetical protein
MKISSESLRSFDRWEKVLSDCIGVIEAVCGRRCKTQDIQEFFVGNLAT